MIDSTLNRHWGITWIALAIAITLHVVDEALNDFLPFYNSLVDTLRESQPWVPLPTFTFDVWITGLVIGVLILLALSPLVFAGRQAMRPLAYFLGVLMIANGLGHIAASIYFGVPVAGVYSSPLLLAAAVALLVTTYRSRRGRR